jgi:hypothetical protein
MDADTITRIVDLAAHVEEIDGKQFHVNQEAAHLIQFPQVETLQCFSLTQVLNFLVGNTTEGLKLFVNVLSPTEVEVLDDELNENLRIMKCARADFSKAYKPFDGGTIMTQEDFVIHVMTKFVRGPAVEALLKLASSVKAEKVMTSDDDGYSQAASVKAGVSLVDSKTVKNLWSLPTYKTFPEIEQPVIPYVLRLHQRDTETPKFALYDADGGAWKIQTTGAIRDWFKQQLKTAGLAENVTVL